MNLHIRSLLLLFFSVSATLSSTPSAFAAEPQWVEIQSPHFSVATDAGEKRGREVAMRFEQMRAVFGALMVKANVNIPIPLQIVAFRNTKELRQVAPLWNGKPIELAGLFQGGEDRSFIMLDMSVENPWTVVFHEYAHQLMNGVLTERVDPWFEEGFAEYFSSIEVDGKEAHVGKLPDYTYQELQQDGLVKIVDLLKVQQNSSTYNESGSHRTVFYAESSLLMHYLYDNKLIPKLSAYFSLKIDKGVPVEDAIQQSFGMSAAEFDNTLRVYLRDGQYRYYSIPTPADIVSRDYGMKPLSLADSKAVVADIHLHSRDYHEKAIAEFQDILKEEPNHAAACRGLGYAYLQKQDFQQAGEYFKRAAQADSKDPRVHYYSALTMSRQGSFSDNSNLPEMIKELQAAIALDPNFADPYMLLAFAQMHAGDNAAGLVSIQKAVALSPRNENYQLNLAQMYLTTRKVDEAIAILQALQKSGTPAVAAHARDSLAQAQAFQAASKAYAARSPQDVQGELNVRGSVRVETPLTGSSAQVLPDKTPPKFLKGIVKAVDCSSPPSATLTVVSGTKSWRMLVLDSKHVVVIGADEFSCSWTKQKVALNYRETSDAAGSVVSIEIQ
jgi:tetratricopeptide (TPR) repeat protein